jgi:DNA polymerase-3 subunit epsilon
MKYVAMDFETGNGNPVSACAVGISVYRDHTCLRRAAYLIRPPEEVGEFHWGNVKIHGIRKSKLKKEPLFDEIWERLRDDVEGSVLVCHNASFDTAVLGACLRYYHLPLPRCRYICTVKVAQKVWPELPNHKLDTVSAALGIALNHHEAGSDADASGRILLAALDETGCADAQELAEHIGMRLGMLSPEKCLTCSTAREIANAARKAERRLRWVKYLKGRPPEAEEKPEDRPDEPDEMLPSDQSDR